MRSKLFLVICLFASFLFVFSVLTIAAPSKKHFTFHLPKDHSVGTILISDSEEILPHDEDGTPARGDIQVPEHSRVRLILNKDQKDLSFLKKCGPTFLILEIECDPQNWTDANLAYFKDLDLRNLRKLDLGSSPVTSAGLPHLTSLKKLAWLNLSHTAVDDEGTRYLLGLKNLYSLNLTDTYVSDASFEYLRQLKKLGSIYLSNTAVTSDCMAKLRKELPLNNGPDIHWGFCQNLKKLKGYIPSGEDIVLKFPKDNSVTGRMDLEDSTLSLPHVAPYYFIEPAGEIILPRQVKIDMSRVEIDSFKTLVRYCNQAALQAITCLPLPRTNFWTDANTSDLAKFSNLTSLNLDYSTISSHHFGFLASLKNLDYLTLVDTQITDKEIEQLAELTNLEYLDLSGTKVTDQTLEKLLTLKRLTALHLANTKITDKSAKTIAAMPQLKHLTLAKTNLTDAAIDQICSKLFRLDALELNDMPHITSQSVRFVAELPTLTRLELGRTAVDDTSILFLEKWIRHMRSTYHNGTISLGIKGTRIREDQVKTLEKMWKELRIRSDFEK